MPSLLKALKNDDTKQKVKQRSRFRSHEIKAIDFAEIVKKINEPLP